MNIFLSSPATRLRRFITGLCDRLREHLPRQADPVPGFLVWQWLHRLSLRLERLADFPARAPALLPSPSAPSLPHWPAHMPAARAPSRRGWLVELSPDFAGQDETLRRLLWDPQIEALLDAAPQLHAALCRLLRLLDTEIPATQRRAEPPATPPAPVWLRPGAAIPRARRQPRADGTPPPPGLIFPSPA